MSQSARTSTPTDLNTAKQELKRIIDEAIVKVDQYNQLIDDMNSPELPIEAIDFGNSLYNNVVCFLDGLI